MAAETWLHGEAFANAVWAACAAYDVDPLAAAAVSYHEGIGGGIGDQGMAYGPWQDHLTGYAGRPWYGHGADNPTVQIWAWSKAGIEYVIRQMAVGGARGLRGHAAVHAIVYGFERPADKLKEVADSNAHYDYLHSLGRRAKAAYAASAHGPDLSGGIPGASAAPAAPLPYTPPPKTKVQAPLARSAFSRLVKTLGVDVPGRAAATRQVASRLHKTVS